MVAGSDHEGDGGWPPPDHFVQDYREDLKKRRLIKDREDADLLTSEPSE